MNDDLISRQAAIDALGKGAMVNYQAAGHDNGLIKAIGVIKGLPPAQPERIRGRWVENPHVHGVVYCSLCDYELHTNDTNFCPNCGADMSVYEEPVKISLGIN